MPFPSTLPTMDRDRNVRSVRGKRRKDPREGKHNHVSVSTQVRKKDVNTYVA